MARNVSPGLGPRLGRHGREGARRWHARAARGGRRAAHADGRSRSDIAVGQAAEGGWSFGACRPCGGHPRRSGFGCRAGAELGRKWCRCMSCALVDDRARQRSAERRRGAGELGTPWRRDPSRDRQSGVYPPSGYDAYNGQHHGKSVRCARLAQSGFRRAVSIRHRSGWRHHAFGVLRRFGGRRSSGTCDRGSAKPDDGRPLRGHFASCCGRGRGHSGIGRGIDECGWRGPRAGSGGAAESGLRPHKQGRHRGLGHRRASAPLVGQQRRDQGECCWHIVQSDLLELARVCCGRCRANSIIGHAARQRKRGGSGACSGDVGQLVASELCPAGCHH
mmetsp:Transcript_116666/g.371146  ORF Transcript_116666/g.371146 Transcript_116666/m.371146 type:complete len:334 (-) Transcript_116666:765-1766(-)